jgi:phosphate transport system protein
MTRELYQKQLRDTQDALLVMGSMVAKAIERSVEALKVRDIELARRVVAEDAIVNRTRFEIEDRCLLLIATQAPLASDLRMLAAVLHITTDLERMADHAAGIAKIAVMVGGEPPIKPLVDIPRMSELAQEMLHGSLDAFTNRDVEAAVAVSLRDDEVDDLYNRVYRDLLSIMMNDPQKIDRATHLLWAAHNLERIADRVTNICERVVFLVTGHMQEIPTGTDRELSQEGLLADHDLISGDHSTPEPPNSNGRLNGATPSQE